MKTSFINVGLCQMSSEFFELSYQRGYDSEDFINKLMTSEVGSELYDSTSNSRWLGKEYMMQTLEYELKCNGQSIKKGKPLNIDFMSWVGYLFKLWSFEYIDETAKDIIRQAPVKTLKQVYVGFHVMSFEMAIENLKELYEQSM